MNLICVSVLALLAAAHVCDAQQQTQPRQQQQQQQPKRVLVKKYKRPSNLPKPATRISCPICASDFMAKRVSVDDACFNPRYNLTVSELEIISLCPLATSSCMTETVYVNGVLTALRRKCGGADCAENCVVAGLGMTTKTCSVCCKAFDYDSFSTDSLKQRECA